MRVDVRKQTNSRVNSNSNDRLTCAPIRRLPLVAFVSTTHQLSTGLIRIMRVPVRTPYLCAQLSCEVLIRMRSM